MTEKDAPIRVYRGSKGNIYKIASRKDNDRVITAHLMLGELPSGRPFHGGPKYANNTTKMLESLVIFNQEAPNRWRIVDVQSYRRYPTAANLWRKFDRELVSITIDEVADKQIMDVIKLSMGETVDFSQK